MERMIVNSVFQLRNIKIEPPESHFDFQHFRLMTSPDFIRDFFSDQKIANLLGFLHCKDLINSYHFYLRIESDYDSDEEFSRIVTFSQETINSFLNLSWFTKDNSINTHLNYLYTPNGRLIAMGTNAIFTNCTGEISEATFTYQELEKVNSISNKLNEITDATQEISPTPLKKGITTEHVNRENYNKKNRIQRAIVFLSAARLSSFIVSKISLYMNIYECLFTTDASEIIIKCQKGWLVITLTIKLKGLKYLNL
ncbi:MAG TPA: hypothetical protein VG367_14825 [Mucilaginibacter sp.]|jgi:hypothetical protein|nr:hypothetical protein [Mucilaginibacter sp.]